MKIHLFSYESLVWQTELCERSLITSNLTKKNPKWDSESLVLMTSCTKKKKKVLFLWSNLVQHCHYPKALQNDPVAFSVGIN